MQALVMMLVGSYLSQLAIVAAVVSQTNNCCADMPDIIANLQAGESKQQAQLDNQKRLIDGQQKVIDNLATKVGKGGLADATCERRIDGCYKLVMTRQTWPESKKICEDMGSHLAFVESQREHDAIVGVIQTMQYLNPDTAKVCQSADAELGQVWQIGAKRDSCTGQWIWSGPGDKQQSVAYTNWHAGQPDCWGSSQFCTIISTGFGYQWDDIQCGTHAWSFGCAVCEFA